MAVHNTDGDGRAEHFALPDAPLSVLTETSPAGVRILAVGEVDIASVGELEAAVQAAQDGAAATIVLDMSAVTFLDSMGIRALFEVATQSRQNGNRLSLIASPEVDRVIDLCGLREHLPLV